MYVKRHAVVKDGRRYVYLRLVEAYRDADGRVRHRVLRTLGREDELKASGQLEQLAASFARLDPPPVGTRRHVGPLLLVHHYLARLGLVELVDEAVPMRGRAMLTHGEVIAALVANRLCGPAPLYDVAGWASSAAMAELFGVPAGLLNDDRLGRALEALAPVAEQVRGKLALAAASRCGADLSRLHLDMTAVRFTGGYTARRWSPRDGPPTAPSPGRSRPCRHPPAPGSRSTTGRIRALQRGAVLRRRARAHPRAGPARRGLRHRLRVRTPEQAVRRRRHRVAVRGAAARRHRLGGLVRRRRARRAGRAGPARPLLAAGTALARRPAHRVERRAGQRQIADDDTGATHRLRIAYIWSSEQATSIAEARERALSSAEDALARTMASTGPRTVTVRGAEDRFDRCREIEMADHTGQNLLESITVEPRIDDRLIRCQHPFELQRSDTLVERGRI